MTLACEVERPNSTQKLCNQTVMSEIVPNTEILVVKNKSLKIKTSSDISNIGFFVAIKKIKSKRYWFHLVTVDNKKS